MKIKLYKRAFKKATEDINGKFYLPWKWAELEALDRMWPDETPIEIEISDKEDENE